MYLVCFNNCKTCVLNTPGFCYFAWCCPLTPSKSGMAISSGMPRRKRRRADIGTEGGFVQMMSSSLEAGLGEIFKVPDERVLKAVETAGNRFVGNLYYGGCSLPTRFKSFLFPQSPQSSIEKGERLLYHDKFCTTLKTAKQARVWLIILEKRASELCCCELFSCSFWQIQLNSDYEKENRLYLVLYFLCVSSDLSHFGPHFKFYSMPPPFFLVDRKIRTK